MRAYHGTFRKKNGESRQMRFVKLSDLPEAVLSNVVKGTGRTTNLAEGMELVWDLDTHGFRMFNWKTVLDDVAEIEVENPFGQ